MKIVKHLILLLLSCLVINHSQAQEKDSVSRLLIAVQKNNLPEVKKLVEAGEPVNYWWGYGDDALTYAILYDYREIAKYLLAHGATSREGFNAAVRTGDLAWVKFLIGYKYYDQNAMVPAAETNNLELVNYLISQGFSVNADDKRKSGLFRSYEVSPLGIALGQNDAIVLALVKAGADMEEAFRYCTNTNLKLGKQLIDLGTAVNEQYLWSLRDGDKVLMDYALKKGADPNYTDEKGMNAYLHAVDNQNLKAMRYCIDTLNLSTVLSNAEGHTDLMLAAYDGNRAVLENVLSRNPNLNAVDKYGQNALCHAMYFNQVETIELLLAKGVDLNHQDEDGYTVVVRAAEMGQKKVIDCLLKHNPDLTLKTKTGKNILSFIYDDTPMDLELILKLIASGADPKVTTSFGTDFAYIAIDRCDLELLKKVKELGLPIDRGDDRDRRAGCEDPEVVRYIIENGGDINRLDTWDKTYLDNALYRNDLVLADYLIKKGANVNGIYGGNQPILFEAIDHQKLGFIELLVVNGADLFVETRWNENAMERANKVANSGNPEAIAIVNYLRSKGAMTKEDYKSMTIARSQEMQSFEMWIENKNVAALVTLLDKYRIPFLTKDQVKKVAKLSAETGSLDLLQICFERYKMDINSPLNFEEQTLLHIAAKNNQIELAVLLINKGADANKPDSLNKLPLAYAKKKEMKNHLKDAMKKVD